MGADAGRLAIASNRFYGLLRAGVEQRLARHNQGLGDLAECLGTSSIISSKLTSLDLKSCHIGPTGAAEIAKYMSRNELLTNLNLCINNIRDEGAAAIAEAL